MSGSALMPNDVDKQDLDREKQSRSLHIEKLIAEVATKFPFAHAPQSNSAFETHLETLERLVRERERLDKVLEAIRRRHR